MSSGKTMDLMVAEKPFEKWQGLIAPLVPTDAYVGRSTANWLQENRLRPRPSIALDRID